MRFLRADQQRAKINDNLIKLMTKTKNINQKKKTKVQYF